ncbi:MAG: hypothetical protein IJV80_00115 [Clostridia bacterium]|nr:hypothetical protein [Clostridia bacterium]
MILNKQNYLMENYDIIVLAGQSNAWGFGVGEVDNEYLPDNDIYMLKDVEQGKYENCARCRDFDCEENATGFYIVKGAEDVNDNNEKVACFALNFAKEYKEKCLQPGRKILIIKAPVGGTGFAANQWGLGNYLYNRLTAMTDDALSLNKNNRLVAFLWHQGEHDSVAFPEWSLEERAARYHTALSAQLNDYKARYSAPALPFITGGFVEEWSAKNRDVTDCVMGVLKQICNEQPRSAYIPLNDLNSNNQDTGNGDDIHFSRKSAYEVGKRYFNAFEKLL